MKPVSLLGDPLGQASIILNFPKILFACFALLFTLNNSSAQQILDWSSFLGSSSTCNVNGSTYTYYNLSQNPIIDACLEITISSSNDFGACETGRIVEYNGDQDEVLSLSVEHTSGNSSNTEATITFIFSSPVTDLVIPVLDIDYSASGAFHDVVTVAPGWDAINNPLLIPETGNTGLTGATNCGNGGTACNAELTFDGPLTQVTFSLGFGSLASSASKGEISFGDIQYETAPPTTGTVELNGGTSDIYICPGDDVTISSSGYDVNADQYLIVTDGSFDVIFVSNSDNDEFPVPSDMCGINFFTFSLVTTESGFVPQVGDDIAFYLNCPGDCCDYIDGPIIYSSDSEEPAFTGLPSLLELPCVSEIPPFLPASWTDNCTPYDENITQTLEEVLVSGDLNECSAAEIERTWYVTDACGNEGSFTQTIIIDAQEVLEEDDIINLADLDDLLDNGTGGIWDCDEYENAINSGDFDFTFLYNKGIGACAYGNDQFATFCNIGNAYVSITNLSLDDSNPNNCRLVGDMKVVNEEAATNNITYWIECDKSNGAVTKGPNLTLASGDTTAEYSSGIVPLGDKCCTECRVKRKKTGGGPEDFCGFSFRSQCVSPPVIEPDTYDEECGGTIDIIWKVRLVVIDELTGCESASTFIIDDNVQYPIVGIKNPDILSCTQTNILIDASGSQTNNHLMFNWYDETGELVSSATGLTLEVSLPGTYILEAIDTVNGCTNQDTVFVEEMVDYPELDAGDDVILDCNESNAQLNAQLELTSDIQYRWYTIDGNIISGLGSLSPEVGSTGTYYLEATNTASGCITVDSVRALPIDNILAGFEVSIESPVCEGDANGSVSLTEIIGGTPPYRIEFNGSIYENELNISDLRAGTYLIEISDANGCQINDVIEVEDGSFVEVNVDLTLDIIKLGETITLLGSTNIPENEIGTILWTPEEAVTCPECMITMSTPFETTTYTLTIADIYGCAAEASLVVRVDRIVELFTPNIISPNSDGENDYFTIYTSELDNVKEIRKMMIFDRWGNKLAQYNHFAPNNPLLGWDGNYKGKKVNPVVYVFLAEVELIDGSIENLSGDVTVIQ